MKKLIALFALIPTLSYAQGIEMGIGVAAPITAREIVTDAFTDGLGVVRAARVLDSSPQIFVEFHKVFKAKDIGIGPMLGFTPKINFGAAANSESEQPVGAGIGLLVKIPSKTKQHFNVGVMWLVTGPVTQLAEGYQDGYQAPRFSINSAPLPPTFKRTSVNRVMVVMTISGVF